MSYRISRRAGATALLAMAGLLGTLLIAVPAAPAATIYACQKKKGGTIRIVSSKTKCKKSSEKKIKWSTTGPAGTNGANGTNGTNGANGTNGTNGAAGAPATKLWAVVSDSPGLGNATLVRGSGVVSVTEDIGVLVKFNQDVSQCAWLANRNTTGTGVETAGWAQVSLAGGLDTVDVRTRDDDGGIADGNFHVAVFC